MRRGHKLVAPHHHRRLADVSDSSRAAQVGGQGGKGGTLLGLGLMPEPDGRMGQSMHGLRASFGLVRHAIPALQVCRALRVVLGT